MTQDCYEMFVVNQMNEALDISWPTHSLLPISPYTSGISIQ